MQPYHHITIEERESLFLLKYNGKSFREIARFLHRSPSSVCREWKRNMNQKKEYNAKGAQDKYTYRHKKCHRPSRLSYDVDLHNWVVEKLALYWSPEAIIARWKFTHPNDTVTCGTIYRALEGDKHRVLKECSKRTLPRKGKHRSSHQCYTIHPIRLIDSRPAEANNRSRLGDWDGDTIYGGINKGLLVTCVDRRSRFTCSVLLNSRNQEETKTAVLKALEGQQVRSLTLDNGSEFALFKEMEYELQAPVYFAHRHSPWERGTSENTNGLLRYFYPKGTDFHKVTPEKLNDVLNLLNNRPRKCLGWLSPIEFILKDSKCCT